MHEPYWNRLLNSPGREDLLWELYHENSKRGRNDAALSDEEVLEHMRELHEALPFTGYPAIALPRSLSPLCTNLDKVLRGRVSTYDLSPVDLTLEQMATILYYAYGVTRDNGGTDLPRSFRIVPSAGALYPLELFIHLNHSSLLEPGIYHYNPIQHNIRCTRAGNGTGNIAQALVQPKLAEQASVIIFITALCERSVNKYGDRGYRFALIEAGHVAQNINLVTTALGLGSVNVGGFFDREVDQFLGLDGLSHSSFYIVLVGGMPKPPLHLHDDK